jgi:transcriptional regulator with XRE-family HTH domain
MEESIFAATDSKAARALLGWTQGDLAKACNVSVSTIADFEKGDRVPIAANLTALRQGFEAAGIVFTSDGPTAYGEVSFWLMTEEVQTTLRFRYSFNRGSGDRRRLWRDRGRRYQH